MSIINQTKISAFYFEDNSKFQTCTLFSMNDTDIKLLLCHANGAILLLDGHLIDYNSPNLDIDFKSDLYVKLLQREIIVTDHKVSEYEGKCVRPNFFLIDIIKSCNLNCQYCFRDFNDKRVIDNDILDDICQSIINNCLKYHISKITIQPWGGEPLLALDKICRLYDNFMKSPISLHITIESNGTVMTEKIAYLLDKINASLGISIDGCKFIQDKQRPFVNSPISTYDLIKKNVSILREKTNIDLGGIAVVTKESLPYLEENMKAYISDFGIKRFKFNLAHNSSFRSSSEAFCIDKTQIKYFAQKLFSVYLNLKAKIPTIYESNIEQRKCNLLTKDNSNICISNGCQGGYRMLSFDMNGNVYPCELLDYPDKSIGKISDGRLLSNMVFDALKSKNSYFQTRANEECDDCPWWYFCQGGCTSNLIYSNMSSSSIDEYQCILNKEIYPLIIESILSNISNQNKGA